MENEWFAGVYGRGYRVYFGVFLSGEMYPGREEMVESVMECRDWK